MDITAASKKAAAALFGEETEPEEEITLISELPDISERLVELLKENKIELIEDLVSLDDEALRNLQGINPEDVETIRRIIADNVEIIEEDAKSFPPEESGGEEIVSEEPARSDAVETEEKYECPECGHPITLDMTACPNCGVGLSFEVED
jgi:N utilization substance protein A